MSQRVLSLPIRGWRALQKKREAFWSPPDPLLVDAAGAGELTVAKIRFVVVGFFVLEALLGLWRDPAAPATRMGMTAAMAGMVIAFGVFLLIKRDRYHSWIGFVSSILDVTLVSAVLVALVLLRHPQLVLESRLWLVVYVLAIAATSLRYDRRVSAVTGLLAIAQYSGIVAYSALREPLASPELMPFGERMFALRPYAASLVLLSCVTWISASVVLRTQRLRLLSAKDPLTGLVARGFFLELIQAEVYRAQRYGRDLAVALIDIDHFKTFNDNFGHTVGDEVLRLIAKMLQSGRRSDLVGRLGGEEFIIMFPETDAQGAVRRSEQIRGIIETSSVTVSVGVAGFPADGADIETVIDCADKRLYEAKNSGRNRVVGPDGEFPQSRLSAAFEQPMPDLDAIPEAG